MSVSDFLADSILAPFRMLWEIAPPEYAVPMIVLLVLVYAKVMVDTGRWVEESVDENHSPGAYDSQTGYKYSPEDFD